MRIGLTLRGATMDALVENAKKLEAEGFTSLWLPSVAGGDPLALLAVIGRETSSIELGTAVLQTYPCHPLLQANRAASVVTAAGRGFTLGIGPSHDSYITGAYGIAYDHPGRNTEEYISILAPLLRGEVVDFEGQDWTTHSEGRMVPIEHPIPVLLSALAPRLLRVAGEHTDGTITFMAPAAAIESHVVPKLHAAAAAAGRPTPRIVAGLPVAVHDDIAEARAAVTGAAAIYDSLPNYRRIMEVGGYAGTAEAAVVGDEQSVHRQLRALVDAGATDIWAGVFPVGDDVETSRRRTLDALRTLLD